MNLNLHIANAEAARQELAEIKTPNAFERQALQRAITFKRALEQCVQARAADQAAVQDVEQQIDQLAKGALAGEQASPAQAAATQQAIFDAAKS